MNSIFNNNAETSYSIYCNSEMNEMFSKKNLVVLEVCYPNSKLEDTIEGYASDKKYKVSNNTYTAKEIVQFHKKNSENPTENKRNDFNEMNEQIEAHYDKIMETHAKATLGGAFGRHNLEDTEIKFYIEPEEMCKLSFDSVIDEGFKTILVNEGLKYIENSKLGKLVKYSPSYYYVPMSDENTKKLYNTGNFSDISFKFKLYNKFYAKESTKEEEFKTSEPLNTFALLSSCVFPYGQKGEGGTILEFLNSIKNAFTANSSKLDSPFVDILVMGAAVVETGIGNLVGDKDIYDNFDTTKKKFLDDMSNFIKSSKLYTCPTIKIKQLGYNDYTYKTEDIRFYLTNFDATFSKDLIRTTNNNGVDGVSYDPTYIEFSITLSPSIVPSIKTIEEFLTPNKDTNILKTTLD